MSILATLTQPVRKSLKRLSWVRLFLWRKDAASDQHAVWRFSAAQDVNPLNMYSTELSRKTQKDVFILGSGSSVNSLSDEQFGHIASQVSYGINFWIFHNFVPDVFSFDAGKSDAQAGAGTRALAPFLALTSRDEVKRRCSGVIYLRPENLEPNYLVPVPEELRLRSWVSGRANLLTGSLRQLRNDLRILLHLIVSGTALPSVLPDNGSSVVRMIFLAVAQRHKNIVLIGVDLDQQPHFWQSEAYVTQFRSLVDLMPAPTGRVHGTAGVENRPIGNKEFLIALSEVMREEKIAQLWLGTERSALAGQIPQYVWPT